MKTILINSLMIAGVCMLAACSADNGNGPAVPENTRTLTVTCPDTRTTIGYEGSDYSHLVWIDGDRVAYATDVAGDVFKTAGVADNRFAAEVPAGATADNRLLIVWPAAPNAGGQLAGASAELAGSIDQVAGAPFDGGLLPMYADVSIPADRDQVDALYTVLGSVLRIGIDATGHETEVLRSVTLTAKEKLVGSYTFDAATRVWSFSGTSNKVTVSVTGEKAVLSDKAYVYMVVDPAAYTGVTVTVETDLDTYVYADGAMDVGQKGRTLYRIDLSLDEPVEPVIPYFTQVTDLSELTDDGTYLIVTDRSATQCYATGPKSMTFFMPVALDLTEEGILCTDEVMKHTWKIGKHEATGMYSLWSKEIGQYVGAPGAILSSDYGKFWFDPEIGDDESSILTYYWEIAVDEQSATVQTRRMEDCRFMYKSSVQYFCPCTSQTSGAQPIRIFKLRE